MHVCRDASRFRVALSRGPGRAVGGAPVEGALCSFLFLSLFLSLFWGSPSAAHAETATSVALDYAPERALGCLDANDLRRAVTSQLGHDPFRAGADLQITVQVVRDGADWEGHIAWKDAGGRLVGERRVQSHARDCRDVMAKVAFAIAVQIQLIDLDSRAAAATDASASATAVAPQAPVTVEKVAPPARREPPSVDAGSASGDSAGPSARSSHLAVGMGPLLDIGVGPKLTAAGRLFVLLGVRRWSAEIAADAALPVTRREPDGSGIVVSAAGMSLAGCARVSVVASCLVGRLGRLHAQGEGVDVSRAGSAYFGQMGLRLGASMDIGRFVLGVHAEGLVMLSHWEVTQRDVVVWTVPRMGAFIGADVAVAIF